MKKKIIIVGAAILPVLFLILMIAAVIPAIAAALSGGDQSGGSGELTDRASLSEKTLIYQSIVKQNCVKFRIQGYENLVLAVIQQESGGEGLDPMQCSECPLNVKYPHSPNSIRNPGYSVEVGVEYLASCLRAAKCKSPADIPGISLALQGYNFGGGYISWAQAHGGYSHDNAMAFSEMKAKQMGWKGYGDTDYVDHVLQYYSLDSVTTGKGVFTLPLKKGSYEISRGWGMDGTKFHKGIDFAAPAGTKIFAAAAGTVEYAQFGSAPYGGYGNVVVIKHNDTYETLYGHCSKLLVSAGQKVYQGQLIALVGSTGRSTGNHCHFEVREHGQKVNPKKFINA